MEDDKLFEANAAFDDDRFEAELVITDDEFNAELEEAERKVSLKKVFFLKTYIEIGSQIINQWCTKV